MKQKKNIMNGIALIIAGLGVGYFLIKTIKMLIILIPIALLVASIFYFTSKLDYLDGYYINAIQRISDELEFYASEDELRKAIKIKYPIRLRDQNNPEAYRVLFKGKEVEHTESINEIIADLNESVDIEFSDIDFFFKELEEKIKRFIDEKFNN